MNKSMNLSKECKLPIHVYDFFSGCGGTCKGFQDAGLKIIWAIDNDSDSQKTFRHNFPDTHLVPDKIENVDVKDLQQMIKKSGNYPILFSVSAPCQPFTQQKTSRRIGDNRRNLLDEFTRFMEFYLPDFIFLENVPGLQKMAANEGPFGRFLGKLEANHYLHQYAVVKSLNYGVPQRRRRLILIASRYGQMEFPIKTHGPGTENLEYSAVKDWIFDLPKIPAGSCHMNIPNHITAALLPVNYERILNTPTGGGGRKDWPDGLKLKCHSNGYSGHTDVYGRMNWDKPASCLTTRCTSISNGRFGHPEQNRAISVREAACLQTFPRDFLFFGGITSMARQIGNAVPPLLARRFGESFIEHFLELSRRNHG